MVSESEKWGRRENLRGPLTDQLREQKRAQMDLEMGVVPPVFQYHLERPSKEADVQVSQHPLIEKLVSFENKLPEGPILGEWEF